VDVKTEYISYNISQKLGYCMIVSVTFHFIENDEMKVNREYGCLIMLCLTSFVVHCRTKGHIWNNRNYDNCIFFL